MTVRVGNAKNIDIGSLQSYPQHQKILSCLATRSVTEISATWLRDAASTRQGCGGKVVPT